MSKTQKMRTEAAKVDRDLKFSENYRHLKSLNPHLYDLYRIRHKLRGMIKGVEDAIVLEPTNTRLIYALSKQYADYLECIAEIRSMEEESQYSSIIIERAIRPAMSQVKQQFTDMLYFIKKELNEESDRDKISEEFKKLATSFAQAVTQIENQVSAKVVDLMENKE